MRSCQKMIGLAAVVGLMGATLEAGQFNGAFDSERDDLGYYYAISGGKFPTGNTPNGDNGSGGTFRYLVDDAAGWGMPTSRSQVWQKDDWFPQNAGLALTLKNGTDIVYDNNGIEDGSYGNFYNAVASGTANASTPGLYRGYSMSNNFDWIYAGYFKLTGTTTVTEIIGYFDENAGFDRNSPSVGYRMNIWSNVPGKLLPADTGGFDGDVFTTDLAAGSFTTSDTGVDRVFDTGVTDDILRVTFTTATPLTLQPGEYWFSHDAIVVPEPATLGLFGLGALALGRRRRLA